MIGFLIRFFVVAAMVICLWKMFAAQSGGWIVIAGIIVLLWLFIEL